MSREVISRTYRKFTKAEGNQHISSEYAIGKIRELIKTFRVESILEIGLGIGSISGCVLTSINNNPGIVYHGTEADNFCLSALPKNLGRDFHKLQIFKNISFLPDNQKYDLIIIDGKDQHLQETQKLIAPNGIIAIEGDRLPQQELLQTLFSGHKFVHTISIKKNQDGGPFPSTNWQGGLKVIFVEPTAKQNIWWFKEKISTKFKYMYRNGYL